MKPLLALVLALSACSSAGTPASAPPAAQTDLGRAAPTESAAAIPPTAPSSSTPAQEPTDAPAEPLPERVAALATEPGVYFYTQEGATTFANLRLEEPPEGSLTVGDPQRARRGTVRQRQLREYSERRSRDQVLLFTGDAVLVESATTRFGEGPGAQEIRCEPHDPLLAIDLPLRPGRAWSDAGRCDDLRIALEAEVLRRDSVRIGGRDVPAFVVRIRIEAEGDEMEDRTTTTAWLSPDHRLTLRSESLSEGTIQGAAYTQELSERLVSLTPAT